MLEVAPNLGIAVGTDGVGSKLILAEQTGRYDTVGIDCVAMNVNDVVCVGAEPIALLDYLAVEQADPEVMEQIGIGLKNGAEQAGVEIPGGEVAILPELIRGHPSPNGFDLTATCFGTVALDQLITGEKIAPGDALIGLPSSGLHSNSYSLARRATQGLPLDGAFGDGTLADALLEPTVIYVRAALDLIRSDIPVHGLAHITGGGLLNLLRLNARVGFTIEDPLPVPPIIELVQGARRGLRRRGVGGLQHGLRLRRRRPRGATRTPRATLLAQAPPRHPPDRHRHRSRPAASAPPASPATPQASSRPKRLHSSGQGSRSPSSPALSAGGGAPGTLSSFAFALPVLAGVGDLFAELLGALL